MEGTGLIEVVGEKLILLGYFDGGTVWEKLNILLFFFSLCVL
jgi:hypothetical protein